MGAVLGTGSEPKWDSKLVQSSERGERVEIAKVLTAPTLRQFQTTGSKLLTRVDAVQRERCVVRGSDGDGPHELGKNLAISLVLEKAPWVTGKRNEKVLNGEKKRSVKTSPGMVAEEGSTKRKSGTKPGYGVGKSGVVSVGDQIWKRLFAT